MNRLIKFTNKNNLNIEIGIYPPYLLTKFEESTNVQIYSSKGMLQQGTSYINNTLDIKEGTLYPVVHNLLKKEYISSRDEIVNKKVRVYYHIEPIGRDYLEKTITDFKKNIKGVFDIIEYGEVEKNE